MEDIRSTLATLEYQAREPLQFDLIDFGNTVILKFAPSATTDKTILKLENCAGYSMSYGLPKAITRVVHIDVNPMLGKIYCTITFDNDRTARIMCKGISVE